MLNNKFIGCQDNNYKLLTIIGVKLIYKYYSYCFNGCNSCCIILFTILLHVLFPTKTLHWLD